MAKKKKVKAPKKGKKKKIFKKKMEMVMKEAKAGELNIGKSDKKVTSRKQAIAIALSESKKAAARGSVKKPKKLKKKKARK
jgi:hypothetical protein